MRTRDWVLAALLSLMLSAGSVFGICYGEGAEPLLPFGVCCLLSIVVALPFLAVLILANTGIALWTMRSLKADSAPLSRRAQVLHSLVPRLSVKSVALFTGVMILCWLPYYLGLFPGMANNDTYIQMQMVYPGAHPLPINALLSVSTVPDAAVTDAWLTDHHPFFTTLLYGATASISDALTGSWQGALAFWSTFQLIAFAAEFVISLAWLRSRGAPVTGCLAVYVFLCLMPFIGCNVVFIVKDTLFALAFIPYIMMLLAALLSKGQLFARPRNCVLFIVVALLVCLTKKTGVYVVGATALIGAVTFLVRWKKSPDAKEARRFWVGFGAMLAQGGICALVMFALIPFVVFPLVSVEPGGRQEAWGMLFQQVARASNDHDAEIERSLKEALDGALPYQEAKRVYALNSVDAVKAEHDLAATDEEMGAFVQGYLELGMRYPESYLAALLAVDHGYVSPTEPIRLYTEQIGWRLGFEDAGVRKVVENPMEDGFLKRGIESIYEGLCTIPIINVLFLAVLYVFWIPTALFFVAQRNRLKMGVLFVPFAVSFAFYVIGPVFSSRYLIPFLFTEGLLLLAILVAMKQVCGPSER